MENKAKKLMKIVKDAGYQIYIVGGSVRDSLLKRDVKDIDLVTNAHYQELLELFTSYNIEASVIGAQFSVLQVFYENQRFEIATFRTEKDFYNHRHPKTVKFVDSLYTDTKRRDFTINALAIDIDDNLYDFHNGLIDLKAKLIRAIGNPSERFKEDALRMLRAVRFAIVLDFTIEEKTKCAIEESAHLIKYISKERIIEELRPLVKTDSFFDAIRLLDELNLLRQLDSKLIRMKGFEQQNPHHFEDLWQHTLSVLKTTSYYNKGFNQYQLALLNLAALYHDVGKLETQTIDESGIAHYYMHAKTSSKYIEKIFSLYKVDTNFIKVLSKIVRDHNDVILAKERHVYKFLVKKEYTIEEIEVLLALQKADKRVHVNWNVNEEDELDQFYKLYLKAIELRPFKLQDLAIDGHYIKELVDVDGPQIGKLLEELLQIVFYQPELNNKKRLTDILQRKVNSKML